MSPRPHVDAVRAFLTARIEERWMPGAAWSIATSRGVVSRGALGLAAVEPRAEPLDAATPYDLASLTKPLVTGLLLVMCEQEGKVDLATAVTDLLPHFRNSPHGSRSLLCLATHRAGLAAWQPLYVHESTLDGYLDRIAAEPVGPPVGSVLYSDLGYIVLGAVLERISGRSLPQLFAERIAAPLGLRSTGFAESNGRFATAAPTEQGNAYERSLAGPAGAGHAWREHLLRGEVHDGNAHGLGGAAGHAGLFGSVAEVAAIAREMLTPLALPLGDRARHRLLDAAVDAADRTVGLVCAAGSTAARGVLPATAPGHTGFSGTSLWLDPTVDAVYVLLTNRVHPTVSARNFQWLRRGFHRLARAAVLA